MIMEEGEGSSEMEYTEIVTAADSFDSSVMFHLVKDVLGFVLYMHQHKPGPEGPALHQQIPSILQDISLEFDELKTEYKELETALKQTESSLSSRRNHAGRMREIKHGIRRLEKLMNTVYSIHAAVELMIKEVPDIQGIILILGGSPLRPQYVYEMNFLHGRVVPACDFTRTKAAEGLSKKAIRAFISKGAGSSSYSGPSKLFLLVKAPSTVSMSQHFLPKRDFRYNKKIVPLRLCLKCKVDVSVHDSEGTGLTNSTASDFIWFQCRHVIKGIPCNAEPPEE